MMYLILCSPHVVLNTKKTDTKLFYKLFSVCRVSNYRS